jgi:hypothetical protein
VISEGTASLFAFPCGALRGRVFPDRKEFVQDVIAEGTPMIAGLTIRFVPLGLRRYYGGGARFT